MPDPSNIKLTVSIDGGAPILGPVQGGVVVVGNNVVQLGHQNTSGAKKYRFEIYDYPPGFTTPAGWTQDSGQRVMYYMGPTPPSFTIPAASTVWGNWILRLIIDDGVRPSQIFQGETEQADDLIDDSLGLRRAHASGFLDVAFGEKNQIDQLRHAVHALKTDIRLMAGAVLAGGGEANTASNVGTEGVGVFHDKDGVDLEFRNITDGDLINIALDGTNIVISVDLDELQDLIDAIATTIPEAGGDVVDYGLPGSPLADLRVVQVHTGGAEGDALSLAAMQDGRLVARIGGTLTTVDWIRIVTTNPNGVETGDPGVIAIYQPNDGGTPGVFINIDGGTTWVQLGMMGPAGGDLAGAYPNPDVVAAHWQGQRIEFGPIVDGQFARFVGGLIQGADAPTGGGSGTAGLPYTFVTSTVDGDPGSGNLRMNNADPQFVTMFYVDPEAFGAIDASGFWGNLNQTIGVIKGRLRLQSASDPDTWSEYDVTDYEQASGYRKITVFWIAGDTLPTTIAGDTLITFYRAGNRGYSGWPYLYDDSSTVNSDPGLGALRLNTSAPSTASRIYVDNQDGSARNLSPVFDTWDDSTNTHKGTIVIKGLESAEFAVFSLTAVASQSGYKELTVAHVASSVTFTNGLFEVLFFRTGDEGDPGDDGDDGIPGITGGLPFTFDTGTGNSDPGNGAVRLNNATYASATAIYIDNVDVGGTTLTGLYATWDDSSNSVKGTIQLLSRSDPAAKWIGHVTAVSAQSGYYAITVTHVASSGVFPTTVGDIAVMFARAGDKGDTGAPGGGGGGAPDAHAPTHVQSGTDVINGLALSLTGHQSRTQFTPASLTNPVHGGSSSTLLEGHMRGIDTALGRRLNLAGGTMDSNATIDMTVGQLLNVDYIDLFQSNPPAPASGHSHLSGHATGALRVKNQGRMSRYPIAHLSGNATGGASGNLDIDFDSIDSMIFNSGVYTLDVQLKAWCTNGNVSYPQTNHRRWIHVEFKIGSTTPYVAGMLQQNDFAATINQAYWRASGTTVLISASALSGNRVRIAWGTGLGGAGNNIAYDLRVFAEGSV